MEVNTSAQQTRSVACLVSLLTAGALLSVMAACTGAVVQLYFNTARTWGPVPMKEVRDLHFDYQDSTAIAHTSFLDLDQGDGSRGHFFLRPKSKVDIYLDLNLPDLETNRELFMLACTLLTRSGKVINRSDRPVMLERRSIIYSSISNVVLAPMYFLGLISDARHLRVKLRGSHVEQAVTPLESVEVVMRSASAQRSPPAVYEAQLTVTVQLGLFQRLCHTLGPPQFVIRFLSPAITLLIIFSSIAALGLSFLAARVLYSFLMNPNPQPTAMYHIPAEEQHPHVSTTHRHVQATRHCHISTVSATPSDETPGRPPFTGSNVLDDAIQEISESLQHQETIPAHVTDTPSPGSTSNESYYTGTEAPTQSSQVTQTPSRSLSLFRGGADNELRQRVHAVEQIGRDSTGPWSAQHGGECVGGSYLTQGRSHGSLSSSVKHVGHSPRGEEVSKLLESSSAYSRGTIGSGLQGLAFESLLDDFDD